MRHATLVDVNGPRVLPLLALPIALAGPGLALNWSTWHTTGRAISAELLAAFALVTGFSIGPCYVPSALVMVAAALWRPLGAPPPGSAAWAAEQGETAPMCSS